MLQKFNPWDKTPFTIAGQGNQCLLPCTALQVICFPKQILKLSIVGSPQWWPQCIAVSPGHSFSSRPSLQVSFFSYQYPSCGAAFPDGSLSLKQFLYMAVSLLGTSLYEESLLMTLTSDMSICHF